MPAVVARMFSAWRPDTPGLSPGISTSAPTLPMTSGRPDGQVAPSTEHRPAPLPKPPGGAGGGGDPDPGPRAGAGRSQPRGAGEGRRLPRPVGPKNPKPPPGGDRRVGAAARLPPPPPQPPVLLAQPVHLD